MLLASHCRHALLSFQIAAMKDVEEKEEGVREGERGRRKERVRDRLVEKRLISLVTVVAHRVKSWLELQ